MEIVKVEFDNIEISLKLSRKEFEVFKNMIHNYPHDEDGSLIANQLWGELKHL